MYLTKHTKCRQEKGPLWRFSPDKTMHQSPLPLGQTWSGSLLANVPVAANDVCPLKLVIHPESLSNINQAIGRSACPSFCQSKVANLGRSKGPLCIGLS